MASKSGALADLTLIGLVPGQGGWTYDFNGAVDLRRRFSAIVTGLYRSALVSFTAPLPQVSSIGIERLELAMKTTYAHLDRNTIPSVVSVYLVPTVADDRPVGGAGSGFVYDERGAVVTNEHVVRGVGGDIIVAIDNRQIDSHEELLGYLVTETDPGQVIEVELIRNGRRITESVTLGERPTPRSAGRHIPIDG